MQLGPQCGFWWKRFSLIRPPGTLVPEGLMFYPRCLFFIRRATSELCHPIAAKLCHMIAIWMFFIVLVQNFWGPPPKEIEGQKHAKFGAISDNFRLRSRISPERVKISKIGKTCDHQQFLPRSKKSPVNFGPLTTENCIWVWTHPIMWQSFTAIGRPRELGGSPAKEKKRLQ